MRKLLSVIVCFVILAALCVPAFATGGSGSTAYPLFAADGTYTDGVEFAIGGTPVANDRLKNCIGKGWATNILGAATDGSDGDIKIIVWSVGADHNMFGRSIRLCNGASVTIKFTGVSFKLRSNYKETGGGNWANPTVKIDGKEIPCNYVDQPDFVGGNVVIASATGLKNTEHTVEIIGNGDVEFDNFVVDTMEFSEKPLFAADGTYTEGVEFYTGETPVANDRVKNCIGKGWAQNIIGANTDGSDGDIKIIVWSSGDHMMFQNGIRLCNGASVKINFTGNSFELRSNYKEEGNWANPTVKIDGKEIPVTYTELENFVGGNVVIASATGLKNTEHTVEIIGNGDVEFDNFRVGVNPNTVDHTFAVVAVSLVAVACAAFVATKKH